MYSEIIMKNILRQNEETRPLLIMRKLVRKISPKKSYIRKLM